MSTSSIFEIEMDDIVRMSPIELGQAQRGYVNVGTHAVVLDLDDSGRISVQICARTNEDKPLGRTSVSKAASVAAGGVNPDIGDDSANECPAAAVDAYDASAREHRLIDSMCALQLLICLEDHTTLTTSYDDFTTVGTMRDDLHREISSGRLAPSSLPDLLLPGEAADELPRPG